MNSFKQFCTHALGIATFATYVFVAATALTACGGGGEDEPDPHTCYVDGKPMSREACR
jgi:hypothetical protein